MRYAEIMKDAETSDPGTETVLFTTGKENAIIGAALAEYAATHKRNRTARALSNWFDHNIMIG